MDLECCLQDFGSGTTTAACRATVRERHKPPRIDAELQKLLDECNLDRAQHEGHVLTALGNESRKPTMRTGFKGNHSRVTRYPICG
jgi:hypothetical protein